MSSPGTSLQTVSSRFSNLGCWADCMNCYAPNAWYMAGGCAAFLHVDAYADKDAGDYAATRMQIFPSAIEIGVEEHRASDIQAQFGQMLVNVTGFWLPVTFFPVARAVLEAQKTRCELAGFPPKPTPFLIYSAENLISIYTSSSSAGRRDRQILVAMLRLMVQRGHIDRQTVAVEQDEPLISCSA